MPSSAQVRLKICLGLESKSAPDLSLFTMNEFSIVPYKDDSPFEPWSALADKAFCLNFPSGESIFYFDVMPEGASSGPVLVLIHGLGDEADSWRHIIPLLSVQGFRLLALDLPGFGRSVTQGKISLKNHAKAVIKLVEAVIRPHEDKTELILAGNSMGALVAEIAAFQRPDLVSGLILIDGSIPGGPTNPGPLAIVKILFSRKWYSAYRDSPDALWASLTPFYVDMGGLPLRDKEFLTKRLKARVESPAQERAFFSSQNDLIMTYLFSSQGIKRKIRYYPGKILLIWGKKDNIIPFSSTKVFTALRNDIKLGVIPDAGHLPHQEKPEDTARLMADFAR